MLPVHKDIKEIKGLDRVEKQEETEERKGGGRESLSQVQLFMISQTVTRQAPLSMEFSRQEYWSGLLLLSPGDLSNPGI